MCGIAGIARLTAAGPIPAGLIGRMTEMVRHRGPDDHGFAEGNDCALGHRRLSIIDLAGGRQPIWNEDGSKVIIFNGEIYNHPELRRELSGRGHVFTTQSDTEAILHAYEEYGDSCVDRLRGMFAFAIWDEERKRLFVARDRLGIKPVYYAKWDGWLLFGSEIKSLLCYDGARRAVRIDRIPTYLAFRYVPGPETLFEGIQKLQPGHCLTVEGGKVAVRCYWNVSFREKIAGITEEDCLEEFEWRLREAVRMRLMSEVPLGVFLSGGVDSSVIVGMMSGMLDEPVKTFSVGYPDTPGQSELAYARRVATRYSTDHHEFHLTPVEFRDFLPKLVWYMDEPVADPAAIPLYFISRLAKAHVTVALSGEGADELLAGYQIYRKMLAIEGVRRLPWQGLLQQIVGALRRISKRRKTLKYLEWLSLPLQRRYVGVSSSFTRAEILHLLGEQSRTAVGEVDTVLDRIYPPLADLPALDQMLYLDTKVWLPDDLLIKADKMTMATAVELRVPFLDHPLVEFSARLPDDFKIRGRTTKYLLKRLAERYIPSELIYRPKRGFPVPIGEWFRGDLFSFARDILLDEGGLCRRLFGRAALESLLNLHRSSGEDRSNEIWVLLVLETWHDVYIRSTSLVSP